MGKIKKFNTFINEEHTHNDDFTLILRDINSGSYYTIIDGELCCAAMLIDGGIDTQDNEINWCIVEDFDGIDKERILKALSA